MGGVQAKEEAEVEVHAVRGGQLILRAAPRQVKSSSSEGGPGGGGVGVGGVGGNGPANPLVKRESRLSLVIPYNGRCCILEQGMDVLEKIFLKLTPRELAFLSLTSRAMHLVVSEFLQHHCSSNDLRPKLRRFYEEHSELLLPKEEVLRQRMECNSRHELLLYSARHNFRGKVRRVSLTKVDKFDGLEQGRQVARERDVSLKRDVVVVRGVTKMRFRHVFDKVDPGRHVVQIRMRLSNAVWERELSPQCPAVVTVSRLSMVPGGKREPLVTQAINPQVWATVDHQYPMDLGHASFVFERDSDWFFLRLDAFATRDERCRIEVVFDDTENLNRKKGSVWDFVELRSTEMTNKS